MFNKFVNIYEKVTNYLDSGYPVDVIYLDFQKAFNKVPHKRLLMKLQVYGIDEELIRWIKGRLYQVEDKEFAIDGQYSSWIDVLSGVPQGSVLGQPFFVIFINDIDESLGCNILKFADDTKIYQEIKSPQGVARLQEDLANLTAWSNDWQMLFNVEKCKVMHMGNNTCHGYSSNGSKLESVREEKDLGVHISNDLKWEKQCSQAVAKPNKVLGLIKRNFTDRSKETNVWLGLTWNIAASCY